MAEAARVYARQIGLSLEMQNQCCELKLRAERRLGEILRASPRQRPGQYQRSHDATVAPALAALGVNKSQSSRWQALARLPEHEFETYIRSRKSSGRELTSAGALKLTRKHEARLGSQDSAGKAGLQRGRVAGSLEELVRGRSRFGCVLADPPWPYANQGTRGATSNHYETMEVEALCTLPVRELVAEDAHLHLWTTNAFLFQAKAVMNAWGFEYRSMLVWVKPEMGLGNYWRVSHELLLLGVRGSAPFLEKGYRSWIEAPRQRHSEKPEAVRSMIEKASAGPWLELFARKRSKGWTVWGAQVR